MNETIYVTEDEENIRELLRCTVESFGYTTRVFETAEELLAALEEELPALVLLDVMLPGIDGLEALRRMKQSKATAGVPVLLLTAKSGELDKVRGLDTGAEDYITKPFGVLELSARIRAALRRREEARAGTPEPEESALLERGDVTLDVGSHEVFVEGRPVELTLKEFELLRQLLSTARAVSREELLTTIWGYDYVGETRTLDMHIKTLRAKLGDDAAAPRYIKTVRGVGYRFLPR